MINKCSFFVLKVLLIISEHDNWKFNHSWSRRDQLATLQTHFTSIDCQTNLPQLCVFKERKWVRILLFTCTLYDTQFNINAIIIEISLPERYDFF